MEVVSPECTQLETQYMALFCSCEAGNSCNCLLI